MPTPEAGRKVGVPVDLGRFWTAANMLSLSRLVLVVPVAYLIVDDGPLEIIFGLIAFAMVTDWFDGRLARWSNTVSEWGKVLDPLADKAAAAAITLALFVRGTLPLWFLGLIIARDVVIVVGGVLLARRTRRVPMSLWSGKVAVTGVALTILAALLRADPPVMAFCVGVTSALLIYSSARYALRFTHLWRAAARPAARPAGTAAGTAAEASAWLEPEAEAAR